MPRCFKKSDQTRRTEIVDKCHRSLGTAVATPAGDSHTFEQADEIRLRGLLERLHRGALEAEVDFDVFGDLPCEALKRGPAEERGAASGI